MAIVKFAEVPNGRTKKSILNSDPPEFRYTRRFLVVTDDPADHEPQIIAHGSCPDPFDAHPDDPFAKLINRKIELIAGTRHGWYVVAEYSTNWTEPETETDPTLFRDRVTIGTSHVQQPLYHDAETDEAILNAAGDPFDPPLLVDYALTTFQIEKNVLTIPSWLLSLRNTVNDAAITIRGVSIDAGAARLKDVTVTDQLYHNALPYFQVNLAIEADARGQTANLLNDGLFEINASTGEKQRIRFAGDEVAHPVPLDADGAKIAPEDLPNAAVFLEFNRYPLASWSGLNLPA